MDKGIKAKETRPNGQRYKGQKKKDQMAKGIRPRNQDQKDKGIKARETRPMGKGIKAK